MRKALILMIVVVLGLMVLSGCDKKDGAKTSISNPFIGGSTGLLLDFQKGAPPRQVFDGGDYPFAVTLKVQNMGEADIKKDDISVAITGIKASDFSLTDAAFVKKPTDKLSRKYKDANGNIIEGIIDYVTFDKLNFKSKLAGNQEFTVRGEVCYRYQTKAVSKICITRKILDTTYSKVCKVDGLKTVYSSGAPVKVSNLKELPRGKDKVQFTFDVTHAASNIDLFKAGTNCKYLFANENKVYVKVSTGMSGLSCTGLSGGTTSADGYATLYNRKATITCTQDAKGVTSDFEKIVNIELDYDLKDYKEVKVLVKHAVDE